MKFRSCAVMAVVLAACGGAKDPALQARGVLEATLDTPVSDVTLFVQSAFDPSQVYLVDCAQKSHLLDGQPFCDELLTLMPGAYTVVAVAQDPTCHTTQAHYDVLVTAGHTVEVPITMICDSGGEVVVTYHQPAVSGITWTEAMSGQAATRNICQGGPDVRVEFQVTDPDTACAGLGVTWSAVDSSNNVVTGTLLSNFQAVSGTPCLFSAVIDAGAALDTYQLTFAISDGLTPTFAFTTPVYVMDCGAVGP